MNIRPRKARQSSSRLIEECWKTKSQQHTSREKQQVGRIGTREYGGDGSRRNAKPSQQAQSDASGRLEGETLVMKIHGIVDDVNILRKRGKGLIVSSRGVYVLGTISTPVWDMEELSVAETRDSCATYIGPVALSGRLTGLRRRRLKCRRWDCRVLA